MPGSLCLEALPLGLLRCGPSDSLVYARSLSLTILICDVICRSAWRARDGAAEDFLGMPS